MTKKAFYTSLSILVLPLIVYAQSNVPVVFELHSGINASNVFVQFLNTSGVIDGSYRDNAGTVQILEANTSYSMATLTSPTSVGHGAPTNVPAVLVSNFVSGRVYINFGTKGLSDLGGSYLPDANLPGDTNFGVRYQYLEPTIVGPQANVNLSYIDFAAIPLSMEARNAPNAQNSPQLTTASGLELITATADSAMIPATNVYPSPADILPSTNFARVISPQLNGALYHDWTNYLQNTLQNTTNILKGVYLGTGPQPSTNGPFIQGQSYEFEVTFNTAGDALLKALPGSGNGYCAGVPPVQQGPGLGDTNQSVAIAFADLNTITGIYGNNPAYTVTNSNVFVTNTTGIVNDFFGRVVGDLLAGLSFGFLASTVDFQGTPIGELNSTEWWGGKMPDGSEILLSNTPAGHGLVFDQAQPGQPENYHSYAASLNGRTSGYGFPLQDRLNNNLLAFNTGTDPNSYLLISINADTGAPTLYIEQTPGHVVLRWSSQASSYNLMQNPLIETTNWTQAPETPVEIGSDLVVTSTVTTNLQFYRLAE